MVSAARLVINKAALHEIDLAMVEAFEQVAQDALGQADVPDAAPYGVGLVQEVGFVSYVDGKQVGGTPGAKKPTAMKVRGKGVVVGIGAAFPARFQEMGTAHQPARPFLTPAVMGAAPAAVPLTAAAISKRLGRR